MCLKVVEGSEIGDWRQLYKNIYQRIDNVPDLQVEMRGCITEIPQDFCMCPLSHGKK